MPQRYYKANLKKIEDILIQKGWATTEIALHAPVSQRTVDSVLMGKPAFRSTFKRIADALGVQPDVIIQGHEDDWPRGESKSPHDDKGEFTLGLSMPESEFDETSLLLREFVEMMRRHVVNAEAEFDLKTVQQGKVAITFEVTHVEMARLYYFLVNGTMQQFRPYGDPGDIQPGAGKPTMYLLWWVDEITIPEDCSMDEFRGKHVTSQERFTHPSAKSPW